MRQTIYIRGGEVTPGVCVETEIKNAEIVDDVIVGGELGEISFVRTDSPIGSCDTNIPTSIHETFKGYFGFFE